MITTSSAIGFPIATSGAALIATRKVRRETGCSENNLFGSIEETLNLFDRIVHLHVDELFPKRGRRAARVAADPVVDACRVAARATSTTGAATRRVTSRALTASTSAAASG